MILSDLHLSRKANLVVRFSFFHLGTKTFPQGRFSLTPQAVL